LQLQLDHEVANGLLWEEVKAIWEKGVDETGLVPGSDMETLLKNSSDWKAMSAQQKVDWVDELNENIKAALSWEKLQTALASDNENLKTMINGAADKAIANLDDRTNRIIHKIEEVAPKTVTTIGFNGEKIIGTGPTEDAAKTDAIKQIDAQYANKLEEIFMLYGENGEKDPIGFRQAIRSL
jgi:hypothetical protein